MLKTRVITAIVLLAVLLPITLFAPVGAFGALIGFVVVFAAWEWARLLNVGGAGPVAYAIFTALVLGLSTFLGVAPKGLFQMAAIFWVLAGPFALLRKPVLGAGLWQVFLLFAGIVVFVACWHALFAARTVGVAFVLSLLLVVWLADIGAYFAGKALGRHKLAPSISPGKTWEGAVGGWVAVIVIGSIAAATRVFAPTLFTAFVAASRLVQGAGRAHRAGRVQRDRRPVRVAHEATGRRQGFERSPAGPRRRSGPHRRVVARIADRAVAARLKKDLCKNV